MVNPFFSTTLVLVVATCLVHSGCRSGAGGLTSCDSPTCGYAEESCELPSCGCAEEDYDTPSCGCAEEDYDTPSCGCAEEDYDTPSCGCAEEDYDTPSCGCAEEDYDTPSCGCAEEDCDTVGCGNRVGCGKDSCGWLKKLFGCFKLNGCGGCDGELYWSEWHNDPPGCEPCDSCGNWIGPRGVYRAPYRTLPGHIAETYGTRLPELATPLLVPEEEIAQDGLPEADYPTESQLNDYPTEPSEDFTLQGESVEKESFELVLDRETIFR